MRHVRRCGYAVVKNGFAPRTNKGSDALSFLDCRCLAMRVVDHRLDIVKWGVWMFLGISCQIA